jgi:HTH-type transcriptional regulator, cell division transcriptional repressor
MTIKTNDGYFSEKAATLGDRIAAGRRAAGVSQKELARRLGVRLKTIEAWENDLSEPRANRAQMLSSMLGVSLVWLLTGEGEGAPEHGQDEMMTASGREVLREFATLKSEMSADSRKLSRLEKRVRALS